MKDFFCSPHKLNKKLFVKVFLIISICYFFSSIFFGLDFTDSFYHLNQALYPADGINIYSFFLSSVVIKGIISLAGPEIIYLRFLNSLLLFFSVVMPFFLIKVEKPRAEIYLYIACCLFLFAPFNVNILGYDSLSIFILSFIFSVTVLYLQKPGFIFVLLLSTLSAVAVLVRLPNLLVIPIIFLVILYSDKINKGYFTGKLSAIYLLITILIIFFGYSMYYSSPEDFFRSSSKSSYHNLQILFNNYFQHGIKMFLLLFLLLGGYFIYRTKRDKVSKYLLYAVAGAILLILMGLFVIRTKYSQNYSLFLTSMAISMVIVTIIQNNKEWISPRHLVLYLYILFLFINPFGSNTGLLKATSLFLLLPFVLSFSNFKINSYWILTAIVLLPFALIEKLSIIYEDRGISALNTTINIDLFNNISTTETRADFLERIDAEIKELKNRNVQIYFYGDKSHIFHYQFPETNLNIASFFQPIDNLMYFSKIDEKIKNKEQVAIFMVDSYPGNQTGSQPNVIGEKLIQEGFKKIEMASFSYFLKSN